MSANEKSDDVYTSNVAFSTPSGALHIGHALGHVVASTTSNIEHLSTGVEIFTPFGIHSTGKDLYKILQELKLGADSEKYGIPNESARNIIQGTKECQVEKLVSHYRALYENSLKSIGVQVDSESFFSTHERAYHTFVNWTILKLSEKGLIVKTEAYRPYCVLCDDIKAIEKDQSEAYAKAAINWDTVRIDGSGIKGGDFYCRVHRDQLLTIRNRKENAINYGNIEYQNKTINLVREKLKTFPPKYKEDLEDILRTRREKPMERDAKTNIGTPSPFSNGAVIEALSDSNIYMEYFAIAKAISRGLITNEDLSNTLYDYLFLGIGNTQEIEKELNLNNLDKIKEFVTKYAKVDLNLAGFEHKEVHFPFSLFHHAAILPDDFFPKELILTSHITRNGEKMSKSKGNVLYLDDLTNKIRIEGIKGVSSDAALDAIRYFLIGAQPLDKDLDWIDSNFMESGLYRMRKYVSFINDIMSKKERNNSNEVINDWLSTKMQQGLNKGLSLYKQREFRTALIEGFEKTIGSMAKYMHLNGYNASAIIEKAVKAHVMFAMPVIPRIAEELHCRYFAESIESFPDPLIFTKNLEHYDEIEYSLNKDFVKDKLGFLNSKLKQITGRRLLDKSENIEIMVSSDFTRRILEPVLPNENVLRNLHYSVAVAEDGCPDYMAIKHKDIIICR